MAEGGAGKGKGGGVDPAKSALAGPGPGPGPGEEQQQQQQQQQRARPQTLSGAGFCKWFNVRMGFGFISMSSSDGSPVEPPLDVFVHQSKLVMEGFRSLKEGEQVEFTYKKSSKGLESLRVTGPGGGPCAGSERRPKGKVVLQKRKPKGDRCYNCGGLDHHAKECGLPPQPKKCHYCQSITHMVAQCPHKTLGTAAGSQDPHASTSAPGPGGGARLCPPPGAQEAVGEEGEEEQLERGSSSSPLEGSSSSSPEEPHAHRGPAIQRWRKS